MKIYTVTLGFTTARVLALGMERYYGLCTPGLSAHHYFLDQHYPVHRQSNLAKLHEICDKYGIEFMDSGYDRGMVEGWNFILPQIPLQAGDFIIGYDPDSAPDNPGWDLALYKIHEGKPDIAMVNLAHGALANNIKSGYLKGHEELINGMRTFIAASTDMGNVAMTRWDWLKGYHISSSLAYWGGTEVGMVADMRNRGFLYAYALDYTELGGFGHLQDPEYHQYKSDILRGYKQSFEQWLKEKGNSALLEG